ncbi:MAG: hypothetical protein HYY01_12795 [Chloroflexi bacterium]|nr:hypothetical protein [Chloroflexota bacterium]
MTPSALWTGILEVAPDPLMLTGFLGACFLAAIDYVVLWWADRRRALP